MKKFELGNLVATASIDERMKKEPSFLHFIQVSLGRYVNCDWGDLDEEDKKRNDEAVRIGSIMILAAYIYPKTKETVWIITEWDRSATTILYPEER